MDVFTAAAHNKRSGGALGGTDFVRLTATEPARVHGLAHKGDIAVGFDADLVIWDPDRQVTYGSNDLHDNVGYNPWQGRTVTGWPESVLLRGAFLVRDREFVGAFGAGNWLKRETLGVETDASPAAEYQEATT